jgi:hypothetical protein
MHWLLLVICDLDLLCAALLLGTLDSLDVTILSTCLLAPSCTPVSKQ